MSSDLRSLQVEEDLIQLASRPTTPIRQSIDSDRHGGFLLNTGLNPRQTHNESERNVNRLQVLPHLLDLDSPLSRTRANSYENGDAAVSVSRRISVSSSNANGKEFYGQLCEQCDCGGTLDYCNACDATFCRKCWEEQFSHKKNRRAPGSIPHERTNSETARKIRGVLEPQMTAEEQDILHHDDDDTTWFGIAREDAELPVFQDYGRFARIMADTHGFSFSQNLSNHKPRYPSLVSFVGQTGAGKSTIIKLVIDLNTEDSQNFPTPVVGSVGVDVPTSADVHLYSDPSSSNSDTPILYADCEGLQGGERQPLGAKFRKQEKSSKFGRIGSFERKMTNFQHTSEREITWADTHTKRSREFAVTHLYPRLLYTFSDVIVFVLRNPRVIESVFEKLVVWAAAALEKSSNQPVLPHAIIVLNASEYDINPDLWNPQTATKQMLESMSRTVNHNATFKKYADFWRDRQRPIETIEQLIRSYYSSVQVVRIPKRGRPNLIQQQVRKLQLGINSACAFARKRKSALRMLMNADELQPYLQFAFDHFATDLETPFDFVQASFTNSPIPLDFGGNILKLALSLMEAFPNAIDGEIIFKELSYMVASCIMLDSARSKIRGVAEQIFPQYIEHVEAALQNFCDRHWPCEFAKVGKPGEDARCVNVRSGHGSKGHQRKNGKVFAAGNYSSTFSFDGYREVFLRDVYSRLDLLLVELRSRVEEGGEREAQAAAEIHRDTIMVQFFKHAAEDKDDAFVSHTTCYCCLFEPPEHSLRCGHILCTSCLLAYGRKMGRTIVEIGQCPMEDPSEVWDIPWTVMLKPSEAGVRVLSLDGGGIRGIVELEALRQIERALGGNIAVQCFFDLIVGTSTGGVIALGLGAKGWSVEECTRQFESLCRQAFTRRTGGHIPGVSWFVDNYNHSKYRTRPLQTVLTDAFSKDAYLFGGPRPSTSHTFLPKVAVTATSSTGLPVILANYNRRCGEKLSYHFQRPERSALELKIWEAARATSAAPRMFKPFIHEPSKQILMDGAIYHNNPVNIADKERKLLWPDLRDDHPDIVVSIGTAYQLEEKTANDDSSPPSIGRGVLSHGKSLLNISLGLISSTLDSEKAWNSYLEVLQPPSKHRNRYVRLNPLLDEAPPHLDEVEKLRYIQHVARGRFSEDSQIQRVAEQLIATSFYFEKSGWKDILPNGGILVSGHIYNRLPPDSREISEVGRYMRGKMRHPDGVSFIIQEEFRGRQAKCLAIPSAVIDKMIRQGQFNMEKIDVELSDKLATTEILLSIGSGNPCPISRFPRSLLQDDDPSYALMTMLRELGSRKTILPSSQRWAARTPSQVKRRQQWVPPDLNQIPERLHSIASYSDNGYLIGNSSGSRLKKIADRFTGKKPAIDNDLASDESQFPEPVELPCEFVVPPFDGTDIAELDGYEHKGFELDGSTREVLPLVDSQPAELGQPDSDGDHTNVASNGKVIAEHIQDAVEALVQERRILDDMKRDIENDDYSRAVQDSREEAERAVQDSTVAESDALTQAIIQSQKESEERRLLEDLEKEAEDAAVAEAIKESESALTSQPDSRNPDQINEIVEMYVQRSTPPFDQQQGNRQSSGDADIDVEEESSQVSQRESKLRSIASDFFRIGPLGFERDTNEDDAASEENGISNSIVKSLNRSASFALNPLSSAEFQRSPSIRSVSCICKNRLGLACEKCCSTARISEWAAMQNEKSWLAKCNESTKVTVAWGYHIYTLPHHVIKKRVRPDEVEYADARVHLTSIDHREENEIRAIYLIQKHTSVPVPKLIHRGDGFNVFERLPGVNLQEDADWQQIPSYHQETIKAQIRTWIMQLATLIPNRTGEVMSLASSRELVLRQRPPCGPFLSTGDLLVNWKRLGFDPGDINPTSKPVFSHMDLRLRSLVLSPALDAVVGITDWERACYFPEGGRAMHKMAERLKSWEDLFDGLDFS